MSINSLYTSACILVWLKSCKFQDADVTSGRHVGQPFESSRRSDRRSDRRSIGRSVVRMFDFGTEYPPYCALFSKCKLQGTLFVLFKHTRGDQKFRDHAHHDKQQKTVLFIVLFYVIYSIWYYLTSNIMHNYVRKQYTD